MKIVLRTATAIGVASCFAAAHANLLVNPGFETGDFTGWTQSFNTGSDAVQGAVVHSGSYAASFSPAADAAYLSQTIATNPGTTYHVSYWLKNEGGGNEFAAAADGVYYTDVFNVAAYDWHQFTHNFVASGTSADITFKFENSDGLHWYLDDARTVVPEPASMALLGIGAGALLKRRRKSTR